MSVLHVALASALFASPVADVRVHVSQTGSSKDVADSAADVVRALSRVAGLTVVGSAGDADVLVQVTERKRARTGRVVPVVLPSGLLVLPIQERQVVAAVTTPPGREDARADMLSGRHRRTWSGAAADLARQIRAWSRH